MTFKLSEKSLNKLMQCDEDLALVMQLAITYTKYDFGIGETLRKVERQKELVDSGASQTMDSRHLPNVSGESEACDIIVYVNGKVTWEIKYYRKVACAIFRAAIDLGIQVEWGGLWESFVDGPHWQLKNKR